MALEGGRRLARCFANGWSMNTDTMGVVYGTLLFEGGRSSLNFGIGCETCPRDAIYPINSRRRIRQSRWDGANKYTIHV